jgi:hypothetical protein
MSYGLEMCSRFATRTAVWVQAELSASTTVTELVSCVEFQSDNNDPFIIRSAIFTVDVYTLACLGDHDLLQNLWMHFTTIWQLKERFLLFQVSPRLSAQMSRTLRLMWVSSEWLFVLYISHTWAEDFFHKHVCHEIAIFMQFYMSSKVAFGVDIIVQLITKARIIILILSVASLKGRKQVQTSSHVGNHRHNICNKT